MSLGPSSYRKIAFSICYVPVMLPFELGLFVDSPPGHFFSFRSLDSSSRPSAQPSLRLAMAFRLRTGAFCSLVSVRCRYGLPRPHTCLHYFVHSSLAFDVVKPSSCVLTCSADRVIKMMGISLLHAEEFTKPAVFDEVKQHLIDEFYLVRCRALFPSVSLSDICHRGCGIVFVSLPSSSSLSSA
jgi:hypothetical protein